jgi:hypothetical protein
MTNDHPIGVNEHGDVVFPFRNDTMIAQELRDEIAPHLAAVCRIMDKARASGLKIDFAIQSDAFGRNIPPYVVITKSL